MAIVLPFDAVVDKQRRLSGRYSVCLEAHKNTDRGADREGDEHEVEKPQDAHGESRVGGLTRGLLMLEEELDTTTPRDDYGSCSRRSVNDEVSFSDQLPKVTDSQPSQPRQLVWMPLDAQEGPQQGVRSQRGVCLNLPRQSAHTDTPPSQG